MSSPDDAIVCVSDMRLSRQYYSIDIGTIKMRAVHNRWQVMISGVIGHRFDIVEEVSEALNSIPAPRLKDVEHEFVSAYQRYGGDWLRKHT